MPAIEISLHVNFNHWNPAVLGLISALATCWYLFLDILRIVTFSGGEKGQPETRLSSQELSNVAKRVPRGRTIFQIHTLHHLPN